MRLTYDLDRDLIIRGINAPTATERLEVKSRTSGWELVFGRALRAAEQLPVGSTIKVGIKELGAQDGDFLASNFSGGTWTHTLSGSGASAVYAVPLVIDSEQMRTLLADEDFLDLALVVKVLEPALVREALTVILRVWRTYIDGLEGFPDDPNPNAEDFEQVVFRGAANGYTPLDGDAKVPIAHLPTGATAAHVARGDDPRLSDARVPTGGAGGALSGQYPNPGFAVDMATQAELDTHITATAAALAGKQPLSPDLTAIDALTTLAFGRSFLELVDAAAARALLGLTSAATGNAAGLTSGVLDIGRIPAVASGVQVISTAATIAGLSSGEQAQIVQGAVVTTTDGRRWIYKGSGSKTSAGSYIEMADVTPDWSVISNKPAITNFTVATVNGIAGQMEVVLGSDQRLNGIELVARGSLTESIEGTPDLPAEIAIDLASLLTAHPPLDGQVLVITVAGGSNTGSIVFEFDDDANIEPGHELVELPITAAALAAQIAVNVNLQIPQWAEANNAGGVLGLSTTDTGGEVTLEVDVSSIDGGGSFSQFANGTTGVSGQDGTTEVNYGTAAPYGAWFLDFVSFANRDAASGISGPDSIQVGFYNSSFSTFYLIAEASLGQLDGEPEALIMGLDFSYSPLGRNYLTQPPEGSILAVRTKDNVPLSLGGSTIDFHIRARRCDLQ